VVIGELRDTPPVPNHPQKMNFETTVDDETQWSHANLD
jgi:hypothetical protein